MQIDKAGLVARIGQRLDGRVTERDVERVLDCALEEIVAAIKDGASANVPNLLSAPIERKPSDESSIERHLKTEPLAKRLGISADTLRRAAQKGELRPVRLGHDLLWPESEIQRWLDARRQPEAPNRHRALDG